MTPEARLLADLFTEDPKPAWCVRDTRGNLYGTVPEGYASTSESAIAYFKAKFGNRCPYAVEQLRAFPKAAA